MIAILLAMDIHGLIGKNNDLPWHYPEDLKYFKELTLNKKVLMGRKTFESIINRLGKPLPKRTNVVATKSDFTYEGVEVINNLREYLITRKDEDIFIIGGKQIYDQTIDLAEILYITHVKHIYNGDRFIQIDFSQFKESIINENSDLIFVKYERILK